MNFDKVTCYKTNRGRHYEITACKHERFEDDKLVKVVYSYTKRTFIGLGSYNPYYGDYEENYTFETNAVSGREFNELVPPGTRVSSIHIFQDTNFLSDFSVHNIYQTYCDLCGWDFVQAPHFEDPMPTYSTERQCVSTELFSYDIYNEYRGMVQL